MRYHKKGDRFMIFSKRFITDGRPLCDFDNHVPAPYFRKSFHMDFIPEQAEITVTGLGFYQLRINGHDITKGPLAPYISNPDDIVYYDHYDLTPYLKKGENVLGLLLGNGMRNAFGGFVWDFEKAAFRGPLCLALLLHAEGEGRSLSLEADESFLTHPSPIRFNDLRMGYRYDSRCELTGWDEPGYPTDGWKNAIPCEAPKGEARLCEAEPIRVCKIHSPVKITHHDELSFLHDTCIAETATPIPGSERSNVYVYDFGINSAGITVLKIKNGKPGQKITVRHGEALYEGRFSETTTVFLGGDRTGRYLEYSQCDEFICKGGDETFVPCFKYDGFRYALVEGLTPEQATEDALTFYEMNSGFAERGDFLCSSETLNRLCEMSIRSDRANFYYFPTDCPHREKNGWTGDAAMSAEHMLLHMEAETSMREWLRNVRHAQDKRGALPGIVPTGGWGFAWGNGPAWDSVLFSLTHEIYRHTGDRSIIEENADAMCRYLRYALTRRDERGLCAFGLGDWVDPYQRQNGGKIASPLEVTDSIMLVSCADRAAFLFREAGLSEEEALATEVSSVMRQAVRKHLIDPETMLVAGDCQTSQAFALATGIFEESERPTAEARLLEILHRNDDENACGMIGVRHLFHALIEMGETDLAYRVMTSEGRTGYGSWVKRGATSMLENFPYEDGREMCSQNHHFLADILSIMIQDFAGLSPNPSYRDIHSYRIAPKFPEALSFAEASYRGIDGTLSVRWVRREDGIHVSINAPVGMTGELVLPNGYRTKDCVSLSNPGKHSFTVIRE